MPTEDTHNTVLIKPFKSEIAKRPITPGNRMFSGELVATLDNMGFDAETERTMIEFQVQWDIALKRYEVLKPCISIDQDYDESTQSLDYTIDLFGDHMVTKSGRLSVTYRDYHYLFSTLDPAKCRDVLVTRIAISNVGMIVPYVRLLSMKLDKDGVMVRAPYEIWI